MTSTTMDLIHQYAEVHGADFIELRPFTNVAELALEQRIKELERDAKRLDWLRDTLFTHKWNGVVGSGCAVQWQVAPDFRFRQRDLSDDSGIMAGDFRRAVDRAMSEAALTKAVEISQEYKLP